VYDIELVGPGCWHGVLPIVLGGAVVGVKVIVEEKKPNAKKARASRNRGWIYVAGVGPEEAATQIRQRRHEIEDAINERVRIR